MTVSDETLDELARALIPRLMRISDPDWQERRDELRRTRTEPRHGREDRRCPECDRPVYYGIFCSNRCADADYDRWVAKQRGARRGS